jgi:CRP/FNR family transcriptional regulator, dissimilatory nitrate respiration regulator
MPRLAIQQCELFEGLPQASLARLVAACQPVNCRRGESIFRKGQPPRGLYLIMSGQVKLCIETSQGDEHVMTICQPGDHFGEVATFLHRPYQLCAVAVSTARLQLIEAEVLESECEKTHQLACNLARALASKLYRRVGDLENLLFRKAEVRVARFLLDLLVQSGASNIVHLPARKGLIASRLHMTKEHFSRTLRDLSTHEVLQVRHLDIEILNRGALEDLAR